MQEKLYLDLNDFKIGFKFKTENDIEPQFYLNFFNRFPHLIEPHCSKELNLFFKNVFSKIQTDPLEDLSQKTLKFVNIINNYSVDLFPENYHDFLKEEILFYIHNSASVIYDFVLKNTNTDMYKNIDSMVEQVNRNWKFNKYTVPWYDYTAKKQNYFNFEINKINIETEDIKFNDYLFSINNNELILIHRTSDHLTIQEDYSVQQVLAKYYFQSINEEQNLIPYLLQRIMSESNTSVFEINAFIPINNKDAVNLIIPVHFINEKLVYGEKNHSFFLFLVKCLGAYFSKTNKDSNLFIKAIDPTVNIMTYNKELVKERNNLNEIYGFFFGKDFSYGLNKTETKLMLQHNLHTLKYKKHKPGTFYYDACDIFSHYATDKAISLILGNIQVVHKS